ncbi:MAG: CAP domain-containing protein [Polyangiaceae bacterium]|nr:CAP domain-containing protein [Polyangiaceae bacterium]
MSTRAAAFCLGLLACGCNAPGHSGGGKLSPGDLAETPLGLEAARRYVLDAVNRDRRAAGLQPVVRDEAAERAAQRHVADMIAQGFTAHWGSDGSVPEQRYTEAGGEDFVQENAACFFDGIPRELDPEPEFSADQLDRIQSAFLNELPPADGHRQNILKPAHNLLGVGLAKPVGVDQPCMAQEFVDRYGTYEPLPARARVGQELEVRGSVHPPVEFGGIGVSRIDLARSLPPAHLNATSVYAVPEPFVLYFPAGFKTPKPVALDGARFSVVLPLSEDGRPGRYGVSVWVRHPQSEVLVMTSLRTVLVD